MSWRAKQTPILVGLHTQPLPSESTPVGIHSSNRPTPIHLVYGPLTPLNATRMPTANVLRGSRGTCDAILVNENEQADARCSRALAKCVRLTSKESASKRRSARPRRAAAAYPGLPAYRRRSCRSRQSPGQARSSPVSQARSSPVSGPRGCGAAHASTADSMALHICTRSRLRERYR